MRLREIEAIRLTGAESRNFAEALLNPREPTPRLRAVAKRCLKSMGS